VRRLPVPKKPTKLEVPARRRFARENHLDELGLNTQQALFCQEYLIDLNQTQAAIRAGYSKKTASSIASGLLAKLNIQTRIKELLDARNKRFAVHQDVIVNELLAIVKADIREMMTPTGRMRRLDKMSDSTVAAIQEITPMKGGGKKIKLYDKNKSLELLARHLGMLKDNLNVGFDAAKVQMQINLSAENAPEPDQMSNPNGDDIDVSGNVDSQSSS
jgi:phage terminase small subunit